MKLVMSSLLVAFASSALVAATPAQADPNPATIEAPSLERLDLARRFATATLTPELYVESVKSSARLAAYGGYGKKEDPATEAKLKKFYAWAEPALREHLAKLLEAQSQAYAREFTADELREIIAFSQTKAGQHFMESSDAIDYDPAVMQAQLDFDEAIEPVFEQIQKDRCAAKAAALVAMGDTKAKCPFAAAAETAAG
jgi:hypothetical protein